MKPIRYLLFLVLGIVWSSSWWAACLWGNLPVRESGIRPSGLWVLPVVLSLILFSGGVIYCFVHWEDE